MPAMNWLVTSGASANKVAEVAKVLERTRRSVSVPLVEIPQKSSESIAKTFGNYRKSSLGKEKEA